MIAYLKGVLAVKQTNFVIVEAGGVGYQVGVSSQTLAELPAAGTELRLETYHHRTEADEKLFGFATSSEKYLFEKLITVKGVGPKVALGVLSGMSSSHLIDAISSHNIQALSAAPGIGKKTAERIVLELADKISDSPETAAGGSSAASGGRAPAAISEAASALEALGYKRAAAEKVLQQVARDFKGQKPDVQELIKAGLRHLSS